MISRHLRAVLERAARRAPIVQLTGPRHAGKSTLARAVFPDHEHVPLDDPDSRDFARRDPRGFLHRYRRGAILDEAQRAPALFNYLQSNVDDDPTPGRFVMVGSHDFLRLPSITQSLAGRAAILRLLPPSLAELESRPPLDLRELRRAARPARSRTGPSLMETMLRGFHPALRTPSPDPGAWLRRRIEDFIERDVRQIGSASDLDLFRVFLRLVARQNAQPLNLAVLARGAGISRTTARRWLEILEIGYLVVILAPYSRRFGRRIARTPKVYFLDTGVLCSLLGVRSPDDLAVHPAKSGVFKAFVLSELMKARHHVGLPPDLHALRDRLGFDVDFLFEDGPSLIAIQATAAPAVPSDFLDSLRAWRRMVRDPAAPAAVIHGGDAPARLDTITLHPWHAL